MFESIRLHRAMSKRFSIYCEVHVFDTSYKESITEEDVTKISSFSRVYSDICRVTNNDNFSIFNPFSYAKLLKRLIAAQCLLACQKATTEYTHIFKYHSYTKIYSSKIIDNMSNKLIYDIVNYPGDINSITYFFRFRECIIANTFYVRKYD
jgi:hypothetical protein